MVTPRVSRALNPQKRRRKLSLKQIRAGFGGKRRKASTRAKRHHTHKAPKAKSNPRKAKRRVSAKRRTPKAKVVYRTKYKTRTKKVYVKSNPRKRKRKANAKRRRSSNPGSYLLTMSPVGNPHRKRRKSKMAKARRRVSAKGRSRKSNPTRRRRVARKSNHRRRGSRNPMDSTLLMKGAGVFIGFSAAKKVPPLLGASMNSSPMMTLLSTAITAGVFAWGFKKFKPGPLAEGVLYGGVAGVINQAWNAWAPSSIAGYGGVGDFVNGRFPLPQGPVRFPMVAAPASTPTGSQVNVGAFGSAW